MWRNYVEKIGGAFKGDGERVKSTICKEVLQNWQRQIGATAFVTVRVRAGIRVRVNIGVRVTVRVKVWWVWCRVVRKLYSARYRWRRRRSATPPTTEILYCTITAIIHNLPNSFAQTYWSSPTCTNSNFSPFSFLNDIPNSLINNGKHRPRPLLHSLFRLFAGRARQVFDI